MKSEKEVIENFKSCYRVWKTDNKEDIKLRMEHKMDILAWFLDCEPTTIINKIENEVA